jgi:nucleoside 2-deoxyribosyltransferase
MKKRAYLANGLFSLADRQLNLYLYKVLKSEANLEVYAPQMNEGINDKNAYADSKMIANADLEELKSADILIAVLDGVEIDSGVAAEIGVAYSEGKTIYGLFTDVRQFGSENEEKIDALVKDPTENQFVYRNLFVSGLIKLSGGAIHSTIDNLIDELNEKEGA